MRSSPAARSPVCVTEWWVALAPCALVTCLVACGGDADGAAGGDGGADGGVADASDVVETPDVLDVGDSSVEPDVADGSGASGGDADDPGDVADVTDAADSTADARPLDAADGSGGADTLDGGDISGPGGDLATLLADLDADPEAALCLHQAPGSGWPLDVGGDYLFVSLDPELDQLAGDFNGWVPEPMIARSSYHYAVRSAARGDQYKFTDGSRYEIDVWAHDYAFDSFGQISVVAPPIPGFSRYRLRSAACLREAEMWNAGGPITHVMFAHDGQNLFDRGAPWGGWKLDESTPTGMLVVGLHNTPDRIGEYTPVVDMIGGMLAGGQAEGYRVVFDGLVEEVVTDPNLALSPDVRRGIMGSSLGGLVSLHIALQEPGRWDFVASMSGTIGWGSLELDGETILDLVAAADDFTVPVYLDSGGGADGCIDSDADGVNDDSPSNADNYCENLQLRDLLAADGRTFGTNLWHWFEPGAAHNEAAWAARVFRPLQVFADL